MTDREIDALVAEKIMYQDNPKFDGAETVLCGDVGHFLPHYSTDISAAWQVVEKMISEKYFIYMEFSRQEDKEKWRVTFSSFAKFEVYTVVRKSFTEAICLAALKAEGVEVNDDEKRDKKG